MNAEKPSAWEETLVFLKPEAVMRGFMGRILARFEEKGLSVVALKLVQLSRDQAEKLYQMHVGKHFYEKLVKHITSGPVLVMVIKGPRAISAVRRLLGSTDPVAAEPGSIRGDFAVATTCNMVHASDSVESAKREISILFDRREILSYEKPTEMKFLFE